MNPDPQKSHPTGGFFFSVCRPSASKSQRIAKRPLRFLCDISSFLQVAVFCLRLHFLCWGCKGAEVRKAITSLLLQKRCHFSICRTKAITQWSINQKPLGLVGQNGVARHLLCKCLAQCSTLKQIYNRLRGCLNQEKRNVIIGRNPQMCWNLRGFNLKSVSFWWCF